MAAYRQPMSLTERAPTSPQTPHSPWHSPVPYLFGGLAAMLGLIAFALLILACSYWKLSGYLEGNGESERDLEAGQATNDTDEKPQKPYEEKILVIMAGQEKPTFLATPSMSSSSIGTSRSSSFGDNTSTCTCDQNQKSKENMNDDADNDEDGDSSVKQGSGNEDRVGRTERVERTTTAAATRTTEATTTTDQNV